MTDPTDLIATEELAELLHCSTRLAKRLMKTEGFPQPYRISPRKILHSRQAVLGWLDSTRNVAGADQAQA
jgi:predicted DNA-binding transcriptional regulator AlpA